MLNGHIQVESSRLIQLRNERHLSQIDLANQLGIGPNQISRYETGQNTPGAEILFDLAVFFDVSADYLLGLTDTRRNFGSELSEVESRIVRAMRQGDKLEAIRLIVIG